MIPAPRERFLLRSSRQMHQRRLLYPLRSLRHCLTPVAETSLFQPLRLQHTPLWQLPPLPSAQPPLQYPPLLLIMMSLPPSYASWRSIIFLPYSWWLLTHKFLSLSLSVGIHNLDRNGCEWGQFAEFCQEIFSAVECPADQLHCISTEYRKCCVSKEYSVSKLIGFDKVLR